MSEQKRMNCVCGVQFPEDILRIKIPKQKVKKIDAKGRVETITCTEIILCTHRSHPPSTGWNYVEWAQKRAVEKAY